MLRRSRFILVAALNGKWEMDATCDSFNGFAHQVIVRNGDIVSGNVNFGEDILSLIGGIDSVGNVEIYGNGHWVLGKFLRKVQDWRAGVAKGTLEVGGEATCEGFWDLKKLG